MRLIALSVLLLASPQAAPPVVRDPMRFLNIHEWYGEAAVVIQGSKGGKSVARRFSTKFRVEMPVGVRATLTAMEETRKRFPAGGLPPQLEDGFKKMLKEIPWAPAAPQKEETCELSVRDQTSSETLVAAAGPETRLLKGFMKMDVAGGTYDLRLDGFDPVEMTQTPQKGPARTFKQRALPGGDARKQPLPTDKDFLSGRIPIKPSVSGLYLPEADLESYFEWTLGPEPLPELELDVVLKDYATWLPEGKADGFGVGNELEVRAELRGKGGKPLKEKAVRIAFHLMESSREPGSATNAPKEGGTEFDLSFDAALNPGLDLSLEGRRAATKSPGLTATAKLSCRDFGAWGELVVMAYTDIGRFVEGTTSLQPGDVRIRIPKRAKDSKIADAWKKGPAAAKADDVDDDAQPAGPKTPGDGLTMYEEYRGFFVGGKHVRTDPDQRDLFVLTRTNHAGVKNGVATFEKASGLKVHLDEEEALLKDRRINFNSKAGLGGAQHGVVIMGFTPALSRQAFARPFVAGTNGTPKDYQHIEVAPDVAALPRQTASWSGTTVTGPDRLAAGLAHELAHTVQVQHHGDVGDYDAEWQIAATATAGVFTVTEVVNGVGTPITVILESGAPYPFQKADVQKVSIGGRKGVRSGAWDCLMRYEDANAYVDTRNPAVRVDVHKDEIGGTIFCKKKDGTGSNDPSRAPYDRFGEASLGNCLEQIRVKDWGP